MVASCRFELKCSAEGAFLTDLRPSLHDPKPAYDFLESAPSTDEEEQRSTTALWISPYEQQIDHER